jgi:hypothetical protein
MNISEHLSRTDLENIPLGAERRSLLQSARPTVELTPELMRALLAHPTFANLPYPPEQRERVLEDFMTRNPQLLQNMVEPVLNAATLTLYLYGCVAYADVFGTPHRIAFCFRFDPNQRIFIVFNEKKYNYST